MWTHILIFAAALMLTPLGAKAADLVVWWDAYGLSLADGMTIRT
jgi:hypothetical protein